jgi:hypothetical protein
MADRNGYIGRAPSDSSVIVARQTFSPTGVTTNFTFASGYTIGYLDAYLNGARLIEGQDYTATDGSVVSLVSSATNGDILELVAYKAFNIATIDTAPGNLSVGTNLTVGGYISAGSSITGSVFYGDGSNLTGINSVSFATTAFTLANNATGTNASFSGNVSIGGTLTYEDVTNVDSVGLITARSGINIGPLAGIAATLSANGSAVFSGIVTAAGGFNLGISSAGTTITSGPVKTLNFVGTGNTFAVSGSTVNISIAGGGGGGVTSLDITSNLFF